MAPKKENNSPLALRMEVDTTDGSLYLVEADIVESLETGARDCSNSVVWDEEIFLPSHKYVLMLRKVTKREVCLLRLFGERSPGWKSRPVMYIRLFVGTPFLIASDETVFGANHFTLKERRQCRMILGQA